VAGNSGGMPCQPATICTAYFNYPVYLLSGRHKGNTVAMRRLYTRAAASNGVKRAIMGLVM